MEKHLITIGYDKGELDFEINGSVSEMTLEELNKLRQIIPVAIYVTEEMWRKYNEPKAHSIRSTL